MIDYSTLYALGITLIFVGVLVIIVAVTLISISNSGKGEVEGGGAIIIGPIPIIFGTDSKWIKTILLLSLAFAVTLVVAMVMYYLLFR